MRSPVMVLGLREKACSTHIYASASQIANHCSSATGARDVPILALKSSTDVVINETFVALILDTTDNSARELRFLRTGLEVTGKDGELSSSEDPKVDYQAPETKNEKGDRKYTFLVYPSPHNEVYFVPKGKGPINMQQFEEKNRLGPAIAGLTATIIMDEEETVEDATDANESYAYFLSIGYRRIVVDFMEIVWSLSFAVSALP